MAATTWTLVSIEPKIVNAITAGDGKGGYVNTLTAVSVLTLDPGDGTPMSRVEMPTALVTVHAVADSIVTEPALWVPA